MNNTWNIGIIGAGMIADFHAMAINDIPNANLIGFCDNGSGRSATLAKKYNTKQLKIFKEETTPNKLKYENVFVVNS